MLVTRFSHFPLALVLCLGLSLSAAITTRTPVQSAVTDELDYLSACDDKIGELVLDGFRYSRLSPDTCPPAVISAVIDGHGHIKKVRLRHSSGYKVVDELMLNAVKTANPLQKPPKRMRCPRKVAIVFDTERFSPVRVLLDDGLLSGPSHVSLPYLVL